MLNFMVFGLYGLVPRELSFLFVKDHVIYERKSKKLTRKLVSEAEFPAISPDRAMLAFLRNGGLWVYDIRHHNSRKILDRRRWKLTRDEFRSEGFFPAWSPDSKVLFFTAGTPLHFKPSRSRYSIGPNVEPRILIWSIYGLDVGERGHHEPVLVFGTTASSTFSISSVACPCISPSRKSIYFCRGGDLWKADVSVDTLEKQIEKKTWDINVDWQEERVWAGTYQGGGGGVSNDAEFINRISISPSGNLIAVCTNRYGGSGNQLITILGVRRKARVVFQFHGYDAVFTGENQILYQGEATPFGDYGICQMNTKVRKPVQIVVGAEKPVPMPGSK